MTRTIEAVIGMMAITLEPMLMSKGAVTMRLEILIFNIETVATIKVVMTRVKMIVYSENLTKSQPYLTFL